MSPKALYQSESCHRKLKRSVIPAARLCGASSSTLRERPLCHPQHAAGKSVTAAEEVCPRFQKKGFSRYLLHIVSLPHETSSHPKFKSSVIPGLAEEQLLFSLVSQIPTCVSGLLSVSTRVHWEKCKKCQWRSSWAVSIFPYLCQH